MYTCVRTHTHTHSPPSRGRELGCTDLWDVVLWGLRRGEGHGRHGHHDGLVMVVDGRGVLGGRPDGRVVVWNGGPRRLHLGPLKKLGWDMDKVR